MTKDLRPHAGLHSQNGLILGPSYYPTLKQKNKHIIFTCINNLAHFVGWWAWSCILYWPPTPLPAGTAGEHYLQVKRLKEFVTFAYNSSMEALFPLAESKGLNWSFYMGSYIWYLHTILGTRCECTSSQWGGANCRTNFTDYYGLGD